MNKTLAIVHNIAMKCMLCGCLLFCSISINAQVEVMYSQYMNNMLNINPAYAGNRAGDNITSLYRKQWVNVEGAPTSYSLSWDRGTEDIGDGLYNKFHPVSYGLQIYSDKLGVETSHGFQAFYSYRIKFNQSFLSLGLSGGVINYNAAYSQVSTSNGGDDSFAEDVHAFLPTAGLGILYVNMHWYAGLSVPALLKTKVRNNSYSFTASNSSYFLTGGYILDVTEYLKLKPSFLIKAIQGESIYYDLNLNAWINNSVGLGVSYRPKDAVVGIFQLQLSPRITLGYAYDYLLSYLRYFSSGSHELLIRYEFNRPKNQHILSPRYF